LGVAVAIFALALAACSKSGGTSPTPNPSASPTVNPSATPTPPGCVGVANGIAYVPDGGGGTFHGVQVSHFEDSTGFLCPASQVINVPFAGPVGAFALASDASTALAALSTGSGPPFTRIQDVFGASTGNLIPVGATYDVTASPSPVPSTTPTPVGVSTLTDVNSINIVGTGSVSVGLIGGPGAGVLGLTSLTNAPPQFGGFVPFQGGTPDPGPGNRPIVTLGPNGTDAIVRGPNDALAYSISIVATGYQFTISSIDVTIGYGGSTNLRGVGGILFDPADTGKALVIQAPGANGVTLLSGLPGVFNHLANLTLASRPHSLAIATGGVVAVIGADNGFYIVKGLDQGTLTLVTPFAPVVGDAFANAVSFVGCDGATYKMTNISSVGFSLDQKYLIVVGTPPTQHCTSGNNSSLIAVPFNTADGTKPTPAPSISPVPPQLFTANNIVTRPADTDYVTVR
jgi:hypothetical protein